MIFLDTDYTEDFRHGFTQIYTVFFDRITGLSGYIIEYRISNVEYRITKKSRRAGDGLKIRTKR